MTDCGVALHSYGQGEVDGAWTRYNNTHNAVVS
jgi:hypothetical protein